MSSRTRFTSRAVRALARLGAAFGALAAILLAITAGGLVAGLFGGIAGLAIYGGLFLALRLVCAREEGIL